MALWRGSLGLTLARKELVGLQSGHLHVLEGCLTQLGEGLSVLHVVVLHFRFVFELFTKHIGEVFQHFSLH